MESFPRHFHSIRYRCTFSADFYVKGNLVQWSAILSKGSNSCDFCVYSLLRYPVLLKERISFCGQGDKNILTVFPPLQMSSRNSKHKWFSSELVQRSTTSLILDVLLNYSRFMTVLLIFMAETMSVRQQKGIQTKCFNDIENKPCMAIFPM